MADLEVVSCGSHLKNGQRVSQGKDFRKYVLSGFKEEQGTSVAKAGGTRE